MDILGIITARGGSKGIPQKNLRKIHKKPLIQYTLEVAKKSKINKLIVSTDDPKIIKLSKSLKIEVPFLRPKKISQDNTPTIDVIKHALNFLSNKNQYNPEIIVILQPTSPFRTVKMINDSINMLQRTNSTSVIAVSRVTHPPFTMCYYNSKYLKPFSKKYTKYTRRQMYPVLYYPNGSIYTLWTKTLFKYDSIYGPRIKPIIINEKANIDIDDNYDMFMSEMTMMHWKKYE
ncbi:MAG: acylneuraminate cytidylyltransferase family protein, partial [bacterium]|nr:acylneuraminate cytidylyltransferase family protein [bacterium]